MLKIGSKVAIYKLKKITDTCYNVTIIEISKNNKAPTYAQWEYHFTPNVLIFTELPIEQAKFDVELEPREYTGKNGTIYTFERPKYDFDRISNKETSIIRILDWGKEKAYVYNKNKVMLKNNQNQPLTNENIVLTQIEFDKVGWRLPEKRDEYKIKYLEKQHAKWKEEVSTLRKELTNLKRAKQYHSNKHNKLQEELDEEKEKNSLISSELNTANTIVSRQKRQLKKVKIEKAEQKTKKQLERERLLAGGFDE